MLELFRVLLVLVMLDVGSGEKILVIPFFNTSLAMMVNAIANQLVARNHSVTWLWPQGVPTGKIMDNAKYGMISNMKIKIDCLIID